MNESTVIYTYLCVNDQVSLPKVGLLRVRFLRSAFFRDIELSRQLVAPFTHTDFLLWGSIYQSNDQKKWSGLKKKRKENISSYFAILLLETVIGASVVIDWCEFLGFWGMGNGPWLIYAPHSGQNPDCPTTFFRTRAQITRSHPSGWVRIYKVIQVLNGQVNMFEKHFSNILRKMDIHLVCLTIIFLSCWNHQQLT